MLWRRTKFSFSAKIGRSHPLQSDLEDDGTEEADPAAMPVNLICPDPLNERIEFSSELANVFNNILAWISRVESQSFGKKRAPRFFPTVFSP